MFETLASFALSFLVKFLLGWIGETKQTANDQEVGRLRSELDHALEALRKQQSMAEIAVRLATRDEILARLEEGSI